jgi:hypothetical protein
MSTSNKSGRNAKAMDAPSIASTCSTNETAVGGGPATKRSYFSDTHNNDYFASFSFFRDSPSRIPKNITETAVGPFLRQGSCVGVAIWVLGLALVYLRCPPESFQYLPEAERNANMAVLVVLVSANVSRFFHLIIRDKSLAFVNTGIMVGSMTVQLLALISITLMIALPTPVLVDPVTGLRTHMVRWVEWTVLAFLMTFLTESIDMPGAKLPWVHGLAIGLSTSAGAIFPFCPSWTHWLVVFAISWILFMSLYVRIYQQYQRFSAMKPPKDSSVDDNTFLDYERAKYSLKTIAICGFVWTLLAATYSVIAICRNFVPEDHFLATASLILFAESVFEVISKVWYFNILVEVHNIVFDDASRTMRRLEDLRVIMATIWHTSSDVMVWCSMSDDDHRIHAVVSPSFFEWSSLTPLQEDVSQRQESSGGQKRPTLILEIDPSQGTYVHHIMHLKMDNTFTRDDAVDLIAEASKRKKDMMDEKNDENKKKEELADFNISVLAGLLTRALQLPETDFVLTETTFRRRTRPKFQNGENGDFMNEMEWHSQLDCSTRTSSSQQRGRIERKDDPKELHCEAKVSKIDSSCLVVIRDVSERYERFETEKKLVEQVTARKKDAEANRFTRHEVKNSILACIG